MKLPAAFTKAEEIGILEALGSTDTYFAEFFRSEVDQMTQNIKNDHPIELGTKMEDWREGFAQSLDTIHEYREITEKLNRTILDLKHQVTVLQNRQAAILGRILSAESDKRVLDPVELFSFQEILRAKLEDNLPLNPQECTYVLGRIQS